MSDEIETEEELIEKIMGTTPELMAIAGSALSSLEANKFYLSESTDIASYYNWLIKTISLQNITAIILLEAMEGSDVNEPFLQLEKSYKKVVEYLNHFVSEIKKQKADHKKSSH